MPPRDPRRVDRVAAAVREEVAAFIARDAKDPRITGLVTVTAVEVTRDLRHASVYVSVMGDDAARESTFEGLKSMSNHLRSHVGRALRLQFAPEISFKLDLSVARAARIETLLASIKDKPTGDDTDG
ncbi:MAG TPA: 30S ribosome-binding factor RbfA [Gemmatimonadaceae bacterium]|jgi:ribosome-binding factor A|nr:30S ribosome-binding factor RbfA [Gemmatimonadaceae bacterium]